MRKLWKKALPLLLCLVTLICIAPMAQAAEETGMKVSDDFISVLKEMEGFSAYPYWDVSQWTIGYGTKCPSDKLEKYKKTGITEEIALELLDEELASFSEDVNAFAEKHKLTLKQHQFDALVSFTYNCGSGWMSELNGNFNTAVRSGDTGSLFLYGICLYSTSAGNYILIERRLCEANMYINGVYKAYNKGDSYPDNYKWVFLNGGGAVPRYPIFAYDAKKAPTIGVRFSSIPTGKTADGKIFTYEFAGWYTEAGKKVTKADSSLKNGQVLYARWKNPDGEVVELPTGTEISKETISVTSSSVNVRKGPGTFYAKTGSLTKGTKLSLTQVYTANGYTWGKTNKGWVSLSNTSYEAPVEVEFPQAATVNANEVNYRSGPGTSYKKKGEKNKGDKVTIVSLSDSGKWGKMSDGNWIYMDYVTYDKDKVTKVQLIKKPTVLAYESPKDPINLAGSVVLITYADGRQNAQTISRSNVTDNRTDTSETAKVVAKYGSKSVSFTITFNKKVAKITRQPVAAVVDMGSTAKVSVKASGDGLKYRWYIAAPGSKTYKKTSCTSSSYSVTMDETISDSKVYCKVTDEYGNSVKSKAVTLTGNMVITKQPAKASGALGSKVTTTVKASGVGLKYQWYVANPGESYKKSSITRASYSATMTEAISGRKVYCKITDKYGNTAKTKTVTLTAKATITKQPADAYAPVGKKVKTSVTATGLGLQYQWYVAEPGSSTYSKSSVTSPSYSLTMKKAVNGRKVYCKITDKYGNSVKTNAVTLSSGVAITQQPVKASAYLGSKVTTSVEATGVGLKYRWYAANPGGEFVKSSVTSSSYTTTMRESISGRKVYCVITDKFGNSVKTKTVSLTSQVKITKQPANVSVEVGSEAATSVTASGLGLKYRWYIANDGETDFCRSSVTTATYSFSMTQSRSGRRVYCVITDQYGNSVQSKTVTFTAK